MLFPDLGDAFIPLTEVMACQPRPRQRTWLQRASRQLQGQGGRETKMLRLEHVRQYMVCAMKCGVAPSQPTDKHHSITA